MPNQLDFDSFSRRPPQAPSIHQPETTAAAGLTLIPWEQRNPAGHAEPDTKWKWEHDEVALGLAGGYGEDHKVRNTEFVNAFGQYNRLLSERFYVGLRADFNYDGIANLSYRVTVSPLAGYYLIKEARTSLAFEAGPSVVFEKYQNQSSDTYAGLRLAERFEHKLTDTTKIWQSATYVPQLDRWTEKYLLTFEAALTPPSPRNGACGWSSRHYDSEPAAGNDYNDLAPNRRHGTNLTSSRPATRQSKSFPTLPA